MAVGMIIIRGRLMGGGNSMGLAAISIQQADTSIRDSLKTASPMAKASSSKTSATSCPPAPINPNPPISLPFTAVNGAQV